MSIEESLDKVVEQTRQLRQQRGPHYEHWLRNYAKSVQGHCVKIAENYKRPRWLLGMKEFIKHEQTKINKKE